MKRSDIPKLKDEVSGGNGDLVPHAFAELQRFTKSMLALSLIADDLGMISGLAELTKARSAEAERETRKLEAAKALVAAETARRDALQVESVALEAKIESNQSTLDAMLASDINQQQILSQELRIAEQQARVVALDGAIADRSAVLETINVRLARLREAM